MILLQKWLGVSKDREFKRKAKMIKIFSANTTSYEEVFKREEEEKADLAVEQQVIEIIQEVRLSGDAAIKEYTKRFDGVELEDLLVTQDEISDALLRVDPYLLTVMEEAAENITVFHERQKRENFEVREKEGVILGQKTLPIECAGIYVPGGSASYPSSVLMNAIPAKIAGVPRIIMITPPQKDGSVPDVILAAANIAGITDIYKVGGAQGIAALAYGTSSIPKVDKITGPGNLYVATAKRLVYGEVSIDMVAGPSEILVIADEFCQPSHVAADMLSQAEHDPKATAILLTTSQQLAEDVASELERQLLLLPRGEIARQSLESRGKIVVLDSLNQAMEWSNRFAPEHLELSVENPFELLELVKNAGAVFLGSHVPEALGDYLAGTNHILPTGGTARFSSALSVEDFQKKTNYIYYTKEALEKDKDKIVAFAESEGLHAHGKSVAIRFENK
jgi:histidinol dehydrogenase